MAEHDPDWTFVERNDDFEVTGKSHSHVPASESGSSEDDTDQEFEVVKKGFSPPNFPLLKLTENHYATDVQDDGSDIEVVKDCSGNSGHIHNDLDVEEDHYKQEADQESSESSAMTEDVFEQDDWFTCGYQGNFQGNESDDETYGLAELFDRESSTDNVPTSAGVLFDVDWQPRSRTSPLLLLVLLGFSAGVIMISNSTVIEQEGEVALRKSTRFDVILLSARLNASVEKYDKLRAMYSDLEKSHSDLQRRLDSVNYFAELFRKRGVKQNMHIRSLERLLASERASLRSCEARFLAAVNDRWTQQDSNGSAPVSSLKDCVAAVMQSLPQMNVSSLFSPNSSTERLLHQIAERVAFAKGKVDRKISKLNKKFATTWKQLFENFRGNKNSESDEPVPAPTTEHRDRESSQISRFRKLFKMSNIVGSLRPKAEKVVPEKQRQYCHLKADAEEVHHLFKMRWTKPEADDVPLTYPLPMEVPHGTDFVSSRPETKALVDWPQHEHVGGDESLREDEIEAENDRKPNEASPAKRDIDKMQQELVDERIKLSNERREFELWRETEIKKLSQSKKKMRRQQRSRVEQVKSYASKLRRAYERKITRARRKLKNKQTKLEDRLKNLRHLLSSMIQRRFDQLQTESSADSTHRKQQDALAERYRKIVAAKEAEVLKQESRVVHFTALFHELEVKMDVLQRLHKNLRSKYNSLKEKQMQNYKDLVFDKQGTHRQEIEEPEEEDVEIEDWVPTVWCPDQTGCRSSFKVNPNDGSTWYFPTQICPLHEPCDSDNLPSLAPTATPRPDVKHSVIEHLTKIAPSRPTKDFQFNLFEPTAAFSSNETQKVDSSSSSATSSQSQEEDSSRMRESKWYFDLMRYREKQRAVPLSWYLYWAKGRDELRKEDEQQPTHHLRGIDWYTALMRDRGHQREAESSSGWYFDRMKSRSEDHQYRKETRRHGPVRFSRSYHH